MPAHTGRLVLSTRDPFLLPEPMLLTDALSEVGLLGSPLPGRDGAFSVGERFLQLVTFAGCSVRIALSPEGNAPFCHIRLTGPFEQPVFLSGRNTRPPRCRNCRQPFQGWKPAALSLSDIEIPLVACPTCDQESPLWAYDWKQKAGFGRSFVQVEEVFPGEAVPTPELLALLAGITNGEWRYFYIQDG
ncbi:MAG: hypothetical protein LJE70_11745 [Chromatiaceae bacterium]|nr:hypothetical protein [Chromatiaceae bacterium]